MADEFTRAAERKTLMLTLRALSKQQVDALYKLADLESEELQQIRLLADKIRNRIDQMQQRDQLVKRTLKSLDRLIEAYTSAQQKLPIEAPGDVD